MRQFAATSPPWFNPNTDWGPQIALNGLQIATPTAGGVIALANGDNDIFIVPAGKRAVVMSASAYNTTGAPINVFPELKVGGTYYRLGTTTSVGATTLSGITTNFIYEPGDIIAVNAGAVGVNYSCTIILFPDSSPVKTARILDTINGQSTIYTCPLGKTAYVLSNTITTSAGTVNYCGTTGTPTLIFNLVASGSGAGPSNQIGPGVAVVASTRANPSFNAALAVGDTIQVNGTGPGAIVFVHISEWPA